MLDIAHFRILAAGRGINEMEVRESKWMMKRGKDWVMSGGRFPRMPDGT